MKIKELPFSERPYEKMELYGPKYLSNAELLAIIIKTGTRDKTVIELSQEILSLIETNGTRTLGDLQNISIEQLMNINGIGKVKAIQLKAVLEFTKRMSKPISNQKYKIKSSDDAANYLMEEMRYERKEIVKVVILNSKNEVIKTVDVSMGGTNYSMMQAKDVLVDAVKMSAPKIIMAHNHPSGDSTPSKQDIETTKKVINAAELLGIQVLDHIVIGNGNYTSIVSVLLKQNRKDVENV